MARFGPPDDFSNQPTQQTDFGPGGLQPPEPFEPEPEPGPWYRKPKALLAWTLFVVILIALIIYGIMQLTRGGPSRPSPTPTPTPTTTTTAPTTTTTPSATTAEPAPPPPATGPVTQPPAQPPEQPPEQTPHHHLPGEIPKLPPLPPLPSVITIPQVPTVITLPPHF